MMCNSKETNLLSFSKKFFAALAKFDVYWNDDTRS